EISRAEKPVFEAHLRDCANCANELRDFSALNFSIAEWRTVDFEPLPTPIIRVPFKQEIVLQKPHWLETVRARLTFSPVWATAATLAALLICAGLFWFATNFTNDKNIADNKTEAAPKAIVSPTDEIVHDREIIAANDNPVATNKKVSPVAPIETKEKIKLPDAAPNKVLAATNTASNKSNKSSVAKAEKNISPSKPLKDDIPSLTIEDDEDDSLRLSDIFDEVGMANMKEVKNE
ncbi:MAG: hypothetical protein ACR2LT_00640, partial [Pyrinomonadaceae bacterium]